MPQPIAHLVLLPGMDGTGELLRRFADALPHDLEAAQLRYPADRFLPYSELLPLVQDSLPKDRRFVLVAESFSTPLAIQCAALNPLGLAGLVLCAGFAHNPAHGWRRTTCALLAPILFRIGLPAFAAKRWLTGAAASPSVLAETRSAISSVLPEVLQARLRAVLACDARDEIGRVTVPILYVQATDDQLVNARCSDEIRRIKPDVEVVAIDGPHLLLHTQPLKTAEIIARFVRGLA